jgi:hypothetical protein|mmetsp:Transcript_14227/g.48973  ORF Transcript_14227/g.48973 Transcript_14227/m.48973 type:complete len:100 (-) Transcript_14227:379-678(-)
MAFNFTSLLKRSPFGAIQRYIFIPCDFYSQWFQAMNYLLDVQQRNSTPGLWSKSSDPYDRYHTTYCTTIGLLSYDLSADDDGADEPPPSIPRAFYVRTL